MPVETVAEMIERQREAEATAWRAAHKAKDAYDKQQVYIAKQEKLQEKYRDNLHAEHAKQWEGYPKNYLDPIDPEKFRHSVIHAYRGYYPNDYKQYSVSQYSTCIDPVYSDALRIQEKVIPIAEKVKDIPLKVDAHEQAAKKCAERAQVAEEVTWQCAQPERIERLKRETLELSKEAIDAATEARQVAGEAKDAVAAAQFAIVVQQLKRDMSKIRNAINDASREAYQRSEAKPHLRRKFGLFALKSAIKVEKGLEKAGQALSRVDITELPKLMLKAF